MPIRRGNIYWIKADALEPMVPGTPHPHVVVQADVFNLSRVPTVVVCGITTNMNRHNEAGCVFLDEGEGGLPKRSIVVSTQISVVRKEELGESIGRLSEARVEQVLAGLRFHQRRAPENTGNN
jgi:mRNA interferase MazF